MVLKINGKTYCLHEHCGDIVIHFYVICILPMLFSEMLRGVVCLRKDPRKKFLPKLLRQLSTGKSPHKDERKKDEESVITGHTNCSICLSNVNPSSRATEEKTAWR